MKKGRKSGTGRQGEPGDGWSVVRRKDLVVLAIAAAMLAVTGIAIAGDKDKPADKPADVGPHPARILHMQTAFNPALPGSGEGVRIFTKTVKHMSGGRSPSRSSSPAASPRPPTCSTPLSSGDLEAAFTWSGYAAAKAPVFSVFATVPFGPGPEDMTSWMLEGDGGRIHRDAYEKLGVTGIPCGIQGAKGGGWFRGDLNTVADFKGQRLRFGRFAGEIVSRLGATLVPLPPGEFFYQLQQGKVDGGEMSTPAIDAALGFDKLGAALLHAGLAAALGGARLPDAQGQVGRPAGCAAGADRNRLPGQHRLDAEPLAARAGLGAGKAQGLGRRHQAVVARSS